VTQNFRSAPGEGPGWHQGARRDVARGAPDAAYNRARWLMRSQAGASVVRYTALYGIAVGLPCGDR
jgi:hypothetical protein